MPGMQSRVRQRGSEAMICVTDLHKSYGSLEVLKGVNVQVQAGEVVVIIGPSGTGKSTFLRCLNYLEEPQQGIIEIDGARVDARRHTKEEVRRLRKKTSMVFQTYNLFRNRKKKIFIRKNVRHLEWKILRFSGDSGAWRFQLKSQN